MKKIIALLCITGLLCATILPVGASWHSYANIDELIYGNEEFNYAATQIVTGIAVEKEETDFFNSRFGLPEPITITSIQVTEVLYGDIKVGDTIEVAAYGHKDGVKSDEEGPFVGRSDEGVFLDIGQEYLFFLYERFFILDRQVVNHPNHVYAIDDNGMVVTSYDELDIVSVDRVREFIGSTTSNLYQKCKECKICKSGRPSVKGCITGGEFPSIFDALEILKSLIGMENQIDKCGNALKASLITVNSQKKGAPTIFDALEILKRIAGM